MFVLQKKYINGDLIVDGTITGEHISANTITANKFSGAVEEEYYSFADSQSLIFLQYVTCHEWTFPKTELSLEKGRHIGINSQINMNTGTTSEKTGTFTGTIEVKVPEESTARVIGDFVHESYPTSYEQRVYTVGNKLNSFGAGYVGTLATTRAWRNLKFVPDNELTEKVTNGDFSNGTTSWTASSGSISSPASGEVYHGQLIITVTGTDQGRAHQAITVTAGSKHRVKGTFKGGNGSSGKIYVSTSTSPSDAFLTMSSSTNSEVSSDIFFPETTTVYVILETVGLLTNQTARFDDISVKELEDRTYADFNRFPSVIVPTSGTATIYHRPLGSASVGSWVIIDTFKITFRTIPYTNYMQLNSKVFFGRTSKELECRFRVQHLYSSITSAKIDDCKIYMNSRLVS